jgi:hypothetical protein
MSLSKAAVQEVYHRCVGQFAPARSDIVVGRLPLNAKVEVETIAVKAGHHRLQVGGRLLFYHYRCFTPCTSVLSAIAEGCVGVCVCMCGAGGAGAGAGAGAGCWCWCWLPACPQAKLDAQRANNNNK